MAAKRKPSAPPAPAAHDSSSHEKQIVAKPSPAVAKTPKRNEPESESESVSESESEPQTDPALPAKTITAPQEPSESEDASEEDDEEEVERPKSAVKGPESEPDKKKLKASTAEKPSSSKKSIPAVQRIWTFEDELILLRALSDYHTTNGKLPSPKEYEVFLAGVTGQISFPVTKDQFINKLRKIRIWYKLKKKNGKISQAHDVAVFELCKNVFEDGDAAGAGAASGGVGGHEAGPYFFLLSLIKDLIAKKQCPSWISEVEDVIARIGASSAWDFETKARNLSIQEMELLTSKEKLIVELFDVLVGKF